MIKCWHRLRIRGKHHVYRHCGVAIEPCPCVTWMRSPDSHCPLCEGSGYLATVRSENARFTEYAFDRREARA